MIKKAITFISTSILTFFLLPVLITVCISFSPDSFLTLPTTNWSTKWFVEFNNLPRWNEALIRSTIVSFFVSALSLLFGTPLAYAMARFKFPFKKVIQRIVLLPLLIPPLLIGIGILPLFYTIRVDGYLIDIIYVHTVLVLPIIYLILKNQIENLDPQFEEVARGLGAGNFDVFLRIIFPLLVPAILTSWNCAFIISMNESILTILISNPKNEVLSAVIWSQLKQNPTPLIAVASLINITFIIVGMSVFFLTIKTKKLIDKKYQQLTK
ncbi:MAG: ABC transporter permease subunit [Planctomycetes bacterium]|nr:ABC transporter permease subunit [Planctomycetota bacterium]